MILFQDDLDNPWGYLNKVLFWKGHSARVGHIWNGKCCNAPVKAPLSGVPGHASFWKPSHPVFANTFTFATILWNRDFKLKLLRVSNEDSSNNPRTALWRWHNVGVNWSLLETAFASSFLQRDCELFRHYYF